jgi:hypothetical protein
MFSSDHTSTVGIIQSVQGGFAILVPLFIALMVYKRNIKILKISALLSVLSSLLESVVITVIFVNDLVEVAISNATGDEQEAKELGRNIVYISTALWF